MREEPTYHSLTHENAYRLHGADVFDAAVDPDQLAAFLADAGHELVFAAMGAELVGIASGTVLLHPDKRPAFFINEVCVRDGMRCRGIGAALCNLLMEVARDKGCHGLWLATDSDNVEARALYRKLDARETDAVVVYDWDGALDV